MAYKDRDEALDDFFDHIFGEDEVTDEDHEWFKDKVESWFDKLEGVKPPGRRRAGKPSPIKREGGKGRRSNKSEGEGDYGARSIFGIKGA